MQKVLVANRGEIATRIFRACEELGLQTVGIYAKEDELSIHRFKAQEAYLIGAGEKPTDAYLDIESIIAAAKKSGADAIHPGYGFLSENEHFAKRVREEGLTFVGPKTELLHTFGDKVTAKEAALAAGIETIPGTDHPVASLAEVQQFATDHGFPIMIKAALGGGGRGMRVVETAAELPEAYDRAKSEAKQAFGSDELYVERFIAHGKHVEVQILADQHGHVMHLFERDCSVQRRNQKVVEVAPCIILTPEQRERVCNAAVKLMQHVGYSNAGTVEFLMEDDHFYFIEVNPRVQVEHTITELITGVDIVQSQLRIAAGADLHKDLHLPAQADLHFEGAAIQCRVTTEDPTNNFFPDTGTLDTYRSPGGNGVRLDVGNAYTGAVVTPYFDSLLVKASVHALSFEAACQKMDRVLHEFDIQGVKTNIPFMENVIKNPVFIAGHALTTFIEDHPELLDIEVHPDPSVALLKYVGDVTINGYADLPRKEHKDATLVSLSALPPLPAHRRVSAKQILDQKGPDAVAQWLSDQQKVLLTDTTLRDAHQSLFATRMRTHDMVRIAGQMSVAMPDLFSYEMWGGATFDVAYRFLKESPWERLQRLRKLFPNTLLQMLFRGSNAVGYKNYPDNVIRNFIDLAAKNGMDVFRIFDSQNWLPQMEPSIEAVRANHKIAEVAMCYSGDVANHKLHKYDLNYYKQLAKDIESAGAHILAIKDMAGLLKPEAAYELISTLKDAVSIPIHLHTHDTAGNGIFTYARAVEAGVDVVDVAQSAMSGATSQPSMGSLYYALENDRRRPELNMAAVEHVNEYFQNLRQAYAGFSTSVTTPQTDVYQTEMPGGQYTNLYQQAKGVGLGKRFDDVKLMYTKVNALFGNIIKVTPSSKVVGDMALFMVQNKLTPDDVINKGQDIDFPESVINFFQGNLGQPVGGFPKAVQAAILKDKPAITVRPGSLVDPVDFDATAKEVAKLLHHQPTPEEVVSYILYPKVFSDYLATHDIYGDVTHLDTATFFEGMRLGETIHITFGPGKESIVTLDEIGEPDVEGMRTVYFELNGQRIQIAIQDKAINHGIVGNQKVEPTNPDQIGAVMTGNIAKVLVKTGQVVTKGEALVVTEAMKMETSIPAPYDGVIKHIYVKAGQRVDADDLLIEMAPQEVKK
ncbi:pyruvate carboxylase [Agrilactobacillus composti DSM 18527 = JCM 14202]|uniref:Pyruvate carboxylase n=1 Tax=Agrilactobacillus composti DSM 18527 = JCM 14202 TaxID=1423734 RepID=A0A0R1Y2Q1_9LACO|nr:pyruvate carboxylase [Agrilactobacillus composti]KRM36606.1 pyruvate carboxylase [Agrilactobacillus composti DSM 18527 = JCM 14202]